MSVYITHDDFEHEFENKLSLTRKPQEGKMTLINDLHKVFNLQPFTYNKEIINDKSIDAFTKSTRKLNDKNNNIR